MTALAKPDHPSVPASVEFDRARNNLTAYVAGELDLASAPEIAAAILARIQPGDERVWVDLSTTTFCDSSGIAMLFRLHQTVAEAGGSFVLYQPTAPVLRIIEMCDQGGILSVRS